MSGGPTTTTKSNENTSSNANTLQNALTSVSGTNLTQGNTLGQTYDQGTSQTQGLSSQLTNTSEQGTTAQQGVTGSANYSTANAYEPAKSVIDSMLAQTGQINPNLSSEEVAAAAGLGSNAGTNTSLNPALRDAASYMLGGAGFGEGDQYVKSGWNSLNDALGKTASGYYLDQSNPYLQSMLSGVMDKVSNQVGSQFAGAGRSFSGAHSAALGNGMASAAAPILFNNWQFERGQQADAGRSLASGGVAASGALGQNRAGAVNAMQAAPGMIDATNNPYETMLTASGYGRNTALDALGKINNIAMPSAQAFGEQFGLDNGYSNTTGQTSTTGQQSSVGATAQNTNTQNYGLSSEQNQQLTQNDLITMLNSLGKTSSTGKSSGTQTTTQQNDPLMMLLGAGTMLGSAWLGRPA